MCLPSAGFSALRRSVYRTSDEPTLYAFTLWRHVDLYTSRVSNLVNFGVTHRFYPTKVIEDINPAFFLSFFDLPSSKRKRVVYSPMNSIISGIFNDDRACRYRYREVKRFHGGKAINNQISVYCYVIADRACPDALRCS